IAMSRMLMTLCLAMAVLGSCPNARSHQAKGRSDVPVRDQPALPDRLPFVRYSTKDVRNRTITFYLSETSDVERKLPILLYCPGSGCQSVFLKENDRHSAGVAGFVYQLVKGRAHLLVAEKPGVKFLDQGKQPGSSEGGSEAYLR